MTKNIEQALNNLWVVVRAARMVGDEHDQLKADFALIRQELTESKKDKKKAPTKGDNPGYN